ncbi:MAG: YhbD family protein [Coriobacteriia bacterium]|nr:YhbD family protein [Coriobacteriia bacterium]MCL2750728.1 YhbD family protein [Coriobacteriia bacterium]
MSEKKTETPQDISKKELLQETGISYGQLYRWKREGLIPEDWFEKRSSFTGQETFFPRRLVLERVEAIQSMKDGLSLSEIRDLLNAVPRQTNLRQTLLETGSIGEDFINTLTIQLEGIWLSELSLKAVATLYSALEMAGASSEVQRELVSRVIEELSVEVSAVSDELEADLQPDEATAPEDAAHQVDADEQADAVKADPAEEKNTEEEG